MKIELSDINAIAKNIIDANTQLRPEDIAGNPWSVTIWIDSKNQAYALLVTTDMKDWRSFSEKLENTNVSSIARGKVDWYIHLGTVSDMQEARRIWKDKYVKQQVAYLIDWDAEESTSKVKVAKESLKNSRYHVAIEQLQVADIKADVEYVLNKYKAKYHLIERVGSLLVKFDVSLSPDKREAVKQEIVSKIPKSELSSCAYDSAKELLIVLKSYDTYSDSL